MKTLILLIAAVVMIDSAQARIGETPEQLAGHYTGGAHLIDLGKDVAGAYGVQVEWKGFTHEHWFLNGVVEMEVYHNGYKPFTNQDIEDFANKYGGKFKSWDRMDANGARIYVRPTGGLMIVLVPDGRTLLVESLAYLSAYNSVPHKKTDYYAQDSRTIRPRPAVDPTVPLPLPKWTPSIAVKPAVQPTTILKREEIVDPDTGLPGPTTTPDKRDCAVVATENYNRLKPISYWAAIIGFDYYVNGDRTPIGHAVCAWKVNQDSRVMVVDSDGTLELPTTSTNSQEILTALGSKYSSLWSNTIVTKGHSMNDNISANKGLGVGLSVLAWVIAMVLCWLKGKKAIVWANVILLMAGFVLGLVTMGDLGMLTGPFALVTTYIWWATFVMAIRLAKLDSWWTEKYYFKNPTKYSRAIARHRVRPALKRGGLPLFETCIKGAAANAKDFTEKDLETMNALFRQAVLFARVKPDTYLACCKIIDDAFTPGRSAVLA